MNTLLFLSVLLCSIAAQSSITASDIPTDTSLPEHRQSSHDSNSFPFTLIAAPQDETNQVSATVQASEKSGDRQDKKATTWTEKLAGYFKKINENIQKNNEKIARLMLSTKFHKNIIALSVGLWVHSTLFSRYEQSSWLGILSGSQEAFIRNRNTYFIIGLEGLLMAGLTQYLLDTFIED